MAASIAGLAIGGASTIGIAENAFTVGLSAGWYDTAWAIGAVVSSMLAVRYLRRSQYTTISGLVKGPLWHKDENRRAQNRRV